MKQSPLHAFQPAEAVVVHGAERYNSWPMIQAVGRRLICAYSRGSAHTVDEGARGVFYWENSTIKWRHKYRDELKALLYENARELSALSPLILSEEALPADAPKVSVTAADGSVYVLNHILGDKGVVIIGRDKAATGEASYAVAPGGFKLEPDAKPSSSIAPGEIVILRYGR